MSLILLLIWQPIRLNATGVFLFDIFKGKLTITSEKSGPSCGNGCTIPKVSPGIRTISKKLSRITTPRTSRVIPRNSTVSDAVIWPKQRRLSVTIENSTNDKSLLGNEILGRRWLTRIDHRRYIIHYQAIAKIGIVMIGTGDIQCERQSWFCGSCQLLTTSQPFLTHLYPRPSIILSIPYTSNQQHTLSHLQIKLLQKAIILTQTSAITHL